LRIENWTKLDAEGLWLAWRDLFESEDDAIATAVWCANRLVKQSRSRGTKRMFYQIKDIFIRRYGSDGVGQQVRREVDECWRCEGDDSFCDRCDGSGVYRERWLYVHYFEVAGQRYCFHSYQEPAHLVSGMGENTSSFGSRFTQEELEQLALPMSGLVRMLRYVAAVVWQEAMVAKVSGGPNIRYFWVGDPGGEPY
jgi:hypothetical protein